MSLKDWMPDKTFVIGSIAVSVVHPCAPYFCGRQFAAVDQLHHAILVDLEDFCGLRNVTGTH